MCCSCFCTTSRRASSPPPWSHHVECIAKFLSPEEFGRSSSSKKFFTGSWHWGKAGWWEDPSFKVTQIFLYFEDMKIHCKWETLIFQEFDYQHNISRNSHKHMTMHITWPFTDTAGMCVCWLLTGSRLSTLQFVTENTWNKKQQYWKIQKSAFKAGTWVGPDNNQSGSEWLRNRVHSTTPEFWD